MRKEDVDAMLAAQRAYEEARRAAYRDAGDFSTTLYQFVALPALRALERAVGAKARLEGEGTYATYRLEYGGCVFQAPAGRAD